MAKLSKSLIFSIIGTGLADDFSEKTVHRTMMKTLSEDRALDNIRAETYDSDSTCAGRAALEDFGEVQCCPFKNKFFDCTGCHPGLNADCHRQPVFAADYFYDDNGDYWIENLPSRDCFCDINCKDRGDCCDDVADTCSHWFSPRVSKEIEFDRGTVKYFHAGVGQTFAEATALCKKHGGRIIQPESPADMKALADALGWTGEADRATLWLPWANMDDGEIMPSTDDTYDKGKWVNFVDGTPVPKPLMVYFEGRKKTIDGLGTGCTYFTNDRWKELKLLDAVCKSKSRVLCEETAEAAATAKPTTTKAPTEKPTTKKPTPKPTKAPTAKPTGKPTPKPTDAPTKPATTVDPSSVINASGFMADSVYTAFGGDKQAYLDSLLCSGDNAASNGDISDHFNGSCPPKTAKVQTVIERQFNVLGKKIDKEAKKFFGFKHNLCDVKFAFTAEHVPISDVDFSTAKTMAEGMGKVEATWKKAVEDQLKSKGGKCNNFVFKNQSSVKKIVKWNQDLVKKVKLNSNNLEKKQMTTLGKEVAKAKRDAAKAAKGK